MTFSLMVHIAGSFVSLLTPPLLCWRCQQEVTVSFFFPFFNPHKQETQHELTKCAQKSNLLPPIESGYNFTDGTCSESFFFFQSRFHADISVNFCILLLD